MSGRLRLKFHGGSWVFGLWVGAWLMGSAPLWVCLLTPLCMLTLEGDAP